MVDYNSAPPFDSFVDYHNWLLDTAQGTRWYVEDYYKKHVEAENPKLTVLLDGTGRAVGTVWAPLEVPMWNENSYDYVGPEYRG